MFPKVSLIHTRLEDLPESHQLMINEANGVVLPGNEIEDKRNAIQSTLQAQNPSTIDDTKTRTVAECKSRETGPTPRRKIHFLSYHT